MPLLLLALFVAVPILEVSVIGRVQDLFGWSITIALLLADSLLGAVLVRQEGTRAWQRFTASLAKGQPPTTQVVDGALILFGGALLLTPGFITDAVGLLCVLGPSRKVLNRVLLRRFAFAAGPLGAFLLVRDPDASPRRRPFRRATGGDETAGPPPPRAAPSLGAPPPGAPSGPPSPPGVIDVEVVDVTRTRPRRDR